MNGKSRKKTRHLIVSIEKFRPVEVDVKCGKKNVEKNNGVGWRASCGENCEIAMPRIRIQSKTKTK